MSINANDFATLPSNRDFVRVFRDKLIPLPATSALVLYNQSHEKQNAYNKFSIPLMIIRNGILQKQPFDKVKRKRKMVLYL
jgi:hypothetical protein